MSDSFVARVASEAERQRARYNMLTTGQIAARLSEQNIEADTVRSWIAVGWIKGIDARKPGASRPHYMATWEAVEEFISQGGAPRVAA